MTSISGASKVFAGMAHSLVLTTAGTLWACGDDMNGELCDGLKTSTPSPKNVLTGVQMVAAGYEASIILKTDGTVWSVGYNNNGQLGNGTYSNQDVLVQISF
jgi:alpha-tubulin suppressor-like RCC1 family protein